MIRDQEEIELTVVLGDNASLADNDEAVSIDFLEGVEAAFVTEDLREEFGLEDDTQGIFVREIAADSPYSRSLAPGMIIIEINGEAPESMEAAKNLIKSGVNRLYVESRGRYGYVAIRVK